MNRRFGWLLATILAVGAFCAWWAVQRTDRAMREDLLAQARRTAQALNIDRVRALSGTQADRHAGHRH